MRDECASALTPGSNVFWVLVAALRGFVEGEGGGDLPLEVRGWQRSLFWLQARELVQGFRGFRVRRGCRGFRVR